MGSLQPDLTRVMRIEQRLCTVCIILCGFLLFPAAGSATEASEIRVLAARADAEMRLGIAERGTSRSFDEATALLNEAEQRLAGADLPPTTKGDLALEIQAVREDLEHLVELYGDRFYGVFPLARLTVPPLLANKKLVITEQVSQPPDVAAVMFAARRVADLLDEYHHPYVVFRSSPKNRRLENVASEELLRDGRSTPYNRKTLISALSPEDLAAFDRDELEPRLIDRLATALDAVSLLVLTIGQPVELKDAHVRTIHGDYFQPGAVIQGSPVDAALFVRAEAFDFVGLARDRRDQYQPILIAYLILFALALVGSAQVKWRPNRPLKVFGRLAIGATLFVLGRIFAFVVTVILGRFIPDANAMAMAAWWWPASLGLLVILGGGLIAWIGQARLTDIVPGARGARAVGTIFVLVAMGASSHFITPLMLLDPGAGWANLLPFLLAGLSLALLFAFAARTGPPVPHYFTIGPLLLAPLVGVFLMTASPGLMWLMVGSSAVLWLAAWIRHRIAVARGTEEPEPEPDEAAEIDKERLMKLEKKIPKKL